MPFLGRAFLVLALVSGTGTLAGTSDSLLDTATTSDVCGVCHRDIYRTWKSSAHSQSMENPVFLATFHEARLAGREETVRVCLDCHAPMLRVTNDLDLRDKITWEGVNCDYCHSMKAVTLTDAGPRVDLEVGRVKLGPIKGASAMVHDVRYSSLHESSLVCAPCHQYVNAEGTELMSTYSEWKASSWAKKGQSCQKCHMGLTAGDVVDPRIQRVPEVAVNLHDVPGGHSLAQLMKAVSVDVKASRTDDGVNVDVQLRNKGAGHAVPTGMPGRRVYLDVGVKAGGASLHEERIYERAFVNGKGERIKRDVDYFARGVRPAADTRLRADDTLIESLTFAVPPGPAHITIKLRYEHAPGGGDEDRTSIVFYSERRRLP